ncbi:MAG: DUF1427 family protein [Roseibium sp.]|nr:DUF1427 family protein [Roseibium sp.]
MDKKVILGLLTGLSIGIACRVAGLPLPAPPVLVGALLVVAMTLGYLAVDKFAEQRASTTKDLCGGPSGQAASKDKDTV